MRRSRMMGAVALAAVSTLAIAGCGDGGGEASDGVPSGEVPSGEVASGGDLERYCELQRELQSEGDAETLDALVAAAPPEIAEEIAAVSSAYQVVLETGDEHAAEGVAEEEAAMHAFNEERCGIPNPLEEE